MKAHTSAVEIVPYRPDRDSDGAFALWERNFGREWPITPGILREVTEVVHSRGATCHLAARDQTGQVVGYLASQLRPRTDAEASITALLVAPERQRQGIGTKLLQTALDEFVRERVATVHLGARAEPRFWQGIPTSLPAARAFFEKHGWEFCDLSCDLIMDLRGFAPPDRVSERPRQHGVDFRVASSDDVAGLYRYLETEFPDWRRWFARRLEARGPQDVVIAGRGSQVVGALILSDVRAADWTGGQWRTFLGEDMGSLGPVGVKEADRDRGIGLAMVAFAAQVLRDRGVRNCFVHWPWSAEWYGKLGYRVWRRYWLAQRDLRGL